VLAQSVARTEEKKPATLAGAVAGLLADADVLIRSADDPLLTIEYHRHFTHSLLFIPFGAAIACLLLWPLLRRRLAVPRLYLFCLAGFSLSGVLDALTSYGTMLFWPFSEQRVALNLVPIVDPLFSLILLASLLLGLRLAQRSVARIGLLLCAVYLGFAVVQQQRAASVAAEMIAARAHVPVRQVVKPTLGNLLLWRSVYVHGGRIYVDAVRVGLFTDNRIYPGESVALYDLQTDLADLDSASTLGVDIRRFVHFSDGYVAFHPARPMVLGDMRYSMLPNAVTPLWGIVLDPDNPQRHAGYRFFRDSSRRVRQVFINMLLGRCAAPECVSGARRG